MWHIKKQNGDTYGPVDLLALCRWAADGRIASGDELSQDEQTWQPAEQLAELEMDWVIEVSEGKTFGPFNALALREAYRTGNIPAETALRNRSDNTVTTVGQRLLESLITENQRLTEEEQTLLQSLRKQKAEITHLQSLAESAPSPAPEDEGANDKQADRFQELQVELKAAATRAREDEEAHETAIQELLDKVSALEEQLSARDATADTPASRPTASDTVSDAYTELAGDHDRLLARLQEMSAEFKITRDAKVESERLTGELVRKADEAAEAAEVRAEKATDQLQILEKKHFELVKSYRELNDKFIQLRQKVRAAEEASDVKA